MHTNDLEFGVLGRQVDYKTKFTMLLSEINK